MESTLYAISAPGYLIVFSYTLFAGLFVWLGGRRFCASLTILLQALWMALSLLLAFLLESPDLRFYLARFLFFFTLALLQIYALTRLSLRTSAYLFAYAFVLAEFATALDWYLYYYGVNVSHIPDILPLRLPFFFCFYGGTALLAYLLNRKSRIFYQSLEPTWGNLCRVYVLAILVFLSTNISNVFQRTPFSSSVPAEIFLLRVLMNLTGVVSMQLLHLTMREEQSRRETEGLKQLMEQMYHNYQISQRSIEQVSLRCHDLRHQLNILRRASVSQEENRFLEQMEQEIADFESTEQSGNKVLDTILTSARLNSKGEDIEITSIADGKLLAFLDTMDAAALLGNLLENALEAVRSLPKGRSRLIRFQVEDKNGFVVIRCENTIDHAPVMAEGRPLTTKADKGSHGFGTRSICLIAEKYGGTARFLAEDGWFRVRILLPRPNRP